jgi:hypothetical protein
LEVNSHLEKGEFQERAVDLPPELLHDLIINECEIAKKEYLNLISDIHSVLENCEKLTNDQKLDYCTSERFYMKQYLKHAMVKINRIFPD